MSKFSGMTVRCQHMASPRSGGYWPDGRGEGSATQPNSRYPNSSPYTRASLAPSPARSTRLGQPPDRANTEFYSVGSGIGPIGKPPQKIVGRPDHRFVHPYEPIIESLPAYALRRDPRTFEQQEQFVRQYFGFGERHRGAQLNGRARGRKERRLT